MSKVKLSERAYPHRGGFRVRLTIGEGAYKWATTGRTEQEARELAEAYAAEYEAAADVTIGDLCESYLQYLRLHGRNEKTVTATRNKLRLLLLPLWTRLPDLTLARAKARYVELAESCTSAASHAQALRQARSAWRWACREQIVRGNPWIEVKPLGRANRGKPQIRFDEARVLMSICSAHAERDDAAVAVLLALLCGLRSGEITSLTVRNVDNGGRLLRITDSKTRAGVRPLELPEQLIGAVAVRLIGRGASEPLLRAPARVRQKGCWMRKAVAKYCALAGVPFVCPHSLRGTFAAVAVDAAELPHRVAAALGHTSYEITKAHYVPGDVADRAEQRKRQDLWNKPN